MPRLALAATLVLVLSTPAFAQGRVLDSYCTQISRQDKVASDGFPLTDAGSIIRQDRANYHRFGTPDPDDQGDGTFDSQTARAQIPGMLERGQIDPGLARQIVRSTPYICVDVYARAIVVYPGD